MTDLPSRLRKSADEMETALNRQLLRLNFGEAIASKEANEMREAADEIERLQREVGRAVALSNPFNW